MTTEVNISFNEGLNLIKENNLHQDPESEIIKIQETFSNVIKKSGPDSFNAMLVLFNADSDPVFAIEPRPYTNKRDMYVAFAEMLFAYSSFNATCFVMSNDTRMTTIDNNDTNAAITMEALNISFVGSEVACVVILPYEIQNNEQGEDIVYWKNELFSISSLTDSSQPVQGNMTELFYIMSHIKRSSFNMNTLINYYSFRDFSSVVPEESIAQKIYVNMSKDD